MRSTFAPLVGLLALAAAPALAQAPVSPSPARSSAPRRECFYSRSISGFAAPNDHTVYLRVGASDVYRLDLMGSCLNVDWRQSIALKTTGGSDFICEGLDAELIVPDRVMGPQHCPVNAIHKLTPAEVAALPKNARP
jgi:hypothetical protein